MLPRQFGELLHPHSYLAAAKNWGQPPRQQLWVAVNSSPNDRAPVCCPHCQGGFHLERDRVMQDEQDDQKTLPPHEASRVAKGCHLVPVESFTTLSLRLGTCLSIFAACHRRF